MNLAALLYLTLPAFLFLIYFLKPILGWPIAAAIGLLTIHIYLQHRRNQQPANSHPLMYLLLLIIVLGVLTLMGFADGNYAWDWIKHWALLTTLESNHWPVVINLQEETNYIRFYIGAYLVPAGLTHLTGGGLAFWTALWYGIGLWLGFNLLSQCAKEIPKFRLLWIVPLFLLMGGLDGWAQLAFRSLDSPISITGFHHEWWANNILSHPTQYSSLLCLLLWVPHQSIPAFIAVGLINNLNKPQKLVSGVLAISMLALWSPYALIGALLLFVPRLMEQPKLREAVFRPRLALVYAVLVAATFALVMIWTLFHQLPSGGFCFSCAPSRLLEPSGYLLFLILELAIPLVILRWKLFNSPTSIAAVATLVVLPILGGSVPDPVMRISMPALIYLFVRCAQEMAVLPSRQLATSFALVLMLSGPTVWGEASFHWENGARHKALPASDPLAAPFYTVWAKRTNYTAQEFFETCGWIWLRQYFTSSPPSTYINERDHIKRIE
jgi:hypothetical protein